MNYDEIPEGVRPLVKLLNDFGYETTDSGDGSNYENGMECAIPERHVFGVIPAGEDLRMFANTLDYILIRNGYENAHVEVNFSPGGRAVFMVFPDGQLPPPWDNEP